MIESQINLGIFGMDNVMYHHLIMNRNLARQNNLWLVGKFEEVNYE